MPTEPLTIWSNAKLPPAATEILMAGIAPHRLVMARTTNASILAAAPADPELEMADVAFGQPQPDQLLSLPKLKWVHLTTAGYERYDRPDIRKELAGRGTIVSNSSGVFDEPCAEHALAMMLALARQLPLAVQVQNSTRAWPITEIRRKSHLLLGESVLFLGFGAIARRLVELLTPFKMSLTAVRRSPAGDEPIPVLPVSELDSLLGLADHIINILPAGRETENFLDAEKFAKMKPGAIFYNIGRGSTVDQNALLAALQSGRLAAAYIDVTVPEPLPPEHPLWTTPHCHITPHTAGGHVNESERLVSCFIDNLRHFSSGRELKNRIMG